MGKVGFGQDEHTVALLHQTAVATDAATRHVASIKGVASGKVSLRDGIENCTNIGKLVGAGRALKAKKENPEAFAQAMKQVRSDAGKKAYKKGLLSENKKKKLDEIGYPFLKNSSAKHTKIITDD